MRKLLLRTWLAASALLLVLAVVLGYMSVMMGTLHWDWWLALSLAAAFLTAGAGCFWMCRRAYLHLKAGSTAQVRRSG